METEDRRSISLPERTVERVESRLQRTEWDDPSEYVAYVVEEVLYRVERNDEDDIGAVDDEEVKERLESLGYLNE